MSKARNRILSKRLQAAHYPRTPPRRASTFWKGRVLIGTASNHNSRAGRRWRLRVRLVLKFHTGGFVDYE